MLKTMVEEDMQIKFHEESLGEVSSSQEEDYNSSKQQSSARPKEMYKREPSIPGGVSIKEDNHMNFIGISDQQCSSSSSS